MNSVSAKMPRAIHTQDGVSESRTHSPQYSWPISCDVMCCQWRGDSPST